MSQFDSPEFRKRILERLKNHDQLIEMTGSAPRKKYSNG